MKHLIPCLLLVHASTLTAFADDWGHWRGPHEIGVAQEGPSLIDAIPETGLKPLWRRNEIPSARSAGWSSPTVANGRVVLFTHRRVKVGDGKPPKPKYPYLSPDKRTGMTEAEYAQYEKNRRDEQEAASRFYRYEEVVKCLDADTGEDIWETAKESVYTRFSQSGSPTIVDGKLFFLGAGRVAQCLQLDTGKLVWQKKLPGEFRDEFMQSSFLVADNIAVVLASALFALDVNSGDILWTADEKISGSHSSPMLWDSKNGKRVVVNIGGGSTGCFALNTGKELWRVKSQAQHSTPVIVGDRLLTYGSNRKAGLRCYAMTDAGAEQVWSYHELMDKGSTPVVWDGHVYLQGERKLACVDLANGRGVWIATMEMRSPQYTSLIGADGKLMFTYDGLLMFAATPDKYRLLTQSKINTDGLLADESTFRKIANMDELEKTSEGRKTALKTWRDMFAGGPLRCASPAIVNGRLYIRIEGGLVCYDLKQ